MSMRAWNMPGGSVLEVDSLKLDTLLEAPKEKMAIRYSVEYHRKEAEVFEDANSRFVAKRVRHPVNAITTGTCNIHE